MSLRRPYLWLLLAVMNVGSVAMHASKGSTGWVVGCAAMAAWCGLNAGLSYGTVKAQWEANQ